MPYREQAERDEYKDEDMSKTNQEVKESFWKTCSPGWSGVAATVFACPIIGLIVDVYEDTGKHKGLVGSIGWMIGVFAFFFVMRSMIRGIEGQRGF